MGRLKFVLPACLAVLAACGAERTNDATRVEELPRPAQAGDEGFSKPGKGIAVVSGSQAATIDVHLPATIDTLDPALAEAIRERANAGTEAFVAAAEADRNAAAEQGYDFRPHSLDIKWIEVGPADGRLAAFLGTYASYSGGAHPNVGFGMLNWDRDRNGAITFDDLFEDIDGARSAVADSLKEGLLQEKRVRLKGTELDERDLMETWVTPAFTGNPAVFQGFTIARSTEPGKAGGLVYHFAPYEVGAYAEGIYEVGVGHEAFAEYLKAEYSGSFGGDLVWP